MHYGTCTKYSGEDHHFVIVYCRVYYISYYSTFTFQYHSKIFNIIQNTIQVDKHMSMKHLITNIALNIFLETEQLVTVVSTLNKKVFVSSLLCYWVGWEEQHYLPNSYFLLPTPSLGEASICFVKSGSSRGYEVIHGQFPVRIEWRFYRPCHVLCG